MGVVSKYLTVWEVAEVNLTVGGVGISLFWKKKHLQFNYRKYFFIFLKETNHLLRAPTETILCFCYNKGDFIQAGVIE